MTESYGSDFANPPLPVKVGAYGGRCTLLYKFVKEGLRAIREPAGLSDMLVVRELLDDQRGIGVAR